MQSRQMPSESGERSVPPIGGTSESAGGAWNSWRLAGRCVLIAPMPEYAPTMLYRFFRGLNEIYGVTVLFCFIAAFFIAFAFTVIYPLVPIILIISSIFLVVAARTVFLVLRRVERSLATRALGRGACPACSTACDAIRVGDRRVLECPGCRRAFAESGDPYVPQETPEDAATTARFEQVAGAQS